jgi:hypothetical protein
VTLVAAVAQGVAVAKGHEGVISDKAVDAAGAFAEKIFHDNDVHKMRRDAFGREPESGRHAKREGGVLVCLPGAGGAYYSGDDDKFCLKSSGPRKDSEKPEHVKFGFFLVQGDADHNDRVVGGNGEIFILAWDHRFDDNVGSYRVHLKLRKGKPLPPEP